MAQPTAQAPAWSPWGSIQTLEPVGDGGVLHVRTSAHGGYFVPAELNAKIHEVWRVRTGWYGQGSRDAHWAIVAITFPDLFTPQIVAKAHTLQRNAQGGSYALATRAAAGSAEAGRPEAARVEAGRAEGNRVTVNRVESIRVETISADANPAPQLTPEPEPKPEPAPLKATPRRRHPQFHPEGPVATSVWADWHDSVPEGFVGVCAAPDGDPSAQTWHLVPASEYNSSSTFRFVVDPERHPLWAEHP